MSSARIVAGIVWSLVLAGAGGCTYPIAKQYRLEAAKDVTVDKVQNEPEEYKGLIVIWGGIILHTTNNAEGSELTILQMPLDRAGLPRSPADSAGRFLARTPRFLDPEVWRRGRRVILAGKVEGVESEPLGSTTYAYPVVEIQQIHLWLPYVVGPFYPTYGWPDEGWYGPDYWYGFPYYSYPYLYHYGPHYGLRREGEHEGHEEHEEHEEHEHERR
jgi:outer membrane lipoprotein